MTYSEAIEYIHSIPKFNRVLGNDLLRKLLSKMGNPEKRLRFIHIGGTNGKGSASTMVSEILTRAGYRTGLFTSPYLEYFNERIRIDGIPISNGELVDNVDYIKKISEKYDARVSEFAFVTAAAFKYFYDSGCDFVVLEVGLGGRLDATNVIEGAEASVIMSVGLDHCQYLGSTIGEISLEKLGIVKPGCPLVLYPDQNSEVIRNAEKVCKSCGATLIIPEMPSEYSKDDRSFLYKGRKYQLGMNGSFQSINAAAVLEVISILRRKGYNIDDDAIYSGLRAARIDGRLQYLLPRLLIDGAHNPSAVDALLDYLSGIDRKISFVTAVMQDKDYKSIVRKIASFSKINAAAVTVCEVDIPRCLTAEKLSAEFAECGINAEINLSPIGAVESLMSRDSESLICVCGSLYLAGEVNKRAISK